MNLIRHYFKSAFIFTLIVGGEVVDTNTMVLAK